MAFRADEKLLLQIIALNIAISNWALTVKETKMAKCYIGFEEIGISSDQKKNDSQEGRIQREKTSGKKSQKEK